MTIIYFVITLGILIFIHELGHFIMAKRAGIKVEAFSLGFGPRLLGIKIGETDYRISAFPLGGYVKMLGEDPTDEEATDPRSFSQKSILARGKVVFFGPLMNFVLALVLMPIVFMIGRAEPAYLRESPIIVDVKKDSPAELAGLKKGDLILSIEEEEVATWDDVLSEVVMSPGMELTFVIVRDGEMVERAVSVGELPEIKGGYIGVEPILFIGNEPRVDEVSPGSPAELAGIEAGDLIISADKMAVTNFYDLAAIIHAAGDREIPITVQRGDEEVSISVHPSYSAESKRWVIGISSKRKNSGPVEVVKYNFIDSLVKGGKEAIKLAGLTLDVLYRLLTLQLSYKVLGGPIIIAKVSAEAASVGLANFLYFMAFLSIQLSVLNLLPFPVLDGGHILFLFIEGVRGKPLSERIRSVASQVGFAILITFMLLITLKDIESVWGITSWIKKFFSH
ncbi:MAG: RIP metalloprotease RseP [Myxococcales bacterium]|nr:RIP metalloprotease RseP [Myxococcales bacterium]